MAFQAVLPMPHPTAKNLRRSHRIVVLPDFQGVGIGHRLCSAVAASYLERGYRFVETSSQPALYAQRRADPAWRITRKGHVSAGYQTSDVGLAKTVSARRVTIGYEFIGNRGKKP